MSSLQSPANPVAISPRGVDDATIRRADEAARHWHSDESGLLIPGSAAHKLATCRMFHDTFNPYKPSVIDWPVLDEATLARITALPIWDIAVQTEGKARLRMAAYAATIADPVMRETIARNGWEENRHKEVLSRMVAFYGIKLAPEPDYAEPSDPEWAYLVTGFSECVDSFFAFGLFAMAERSGFFPPELIETFEPVMQEECRHILLFANWLAWHRRTMPAWRRPWFELRVAAVWAFLGYERMGLARSMDADGQEVTQDNNFTVNGTKAVSDADLSVPELMALCLSENDRRFSGYDERLLRPTTMPGLVCFGLSAIRVAQQLKGSPARAEARRERHRARTAARKAAKRDRRPTVIEDRIVAGSERHKELFCAQFIATHQQYDPRTLPWPELTEEELARLRGVPFWQEVFHTERRAAAIVDAFTPQITDPVVREAVALQGREEQRHADLLRVMIERYGLDAQDQPMEQFPPDLETAFIDFGFGECLDAFLGFGAFKTARESEFLPKGMFDIFDVLMFEETRHIVFFINYMAWREKRRGLGAARRAIKSTRFYGRAGKRLLGMVRRGQDANDGKDFAVTQANLFLDGFSFRGFVEDCYRENARRMGEFDPDLMQPRLLPAMAGLAVRGLQVWDRARPHLRAQHKPEAQPQG